MRGVSRDSLHHGQRRLAVLLAAGGTRTDPVRVGEEFFGVVGVLADNPGLRRALTDPSWSAEARTGLVTRLFAGRIGAVTLELLIELVRARWSEAGDLIEAVETLGVSAVLSAAERSERVDAVEDELFRFARVVAGDPGLRDAFSARTVGAERKAALVRRLLEGRAAPETLMLVEQAVLRPRGLRVEQVLHRFVAAAAERRTQLVAHVVVAVAPTPKQRERLAAALCRLYGRPIRLTVDVDPRVVGGMRVRVGGEVVDGTVSSRLDDVARRLAG